MNKKIFEHKITNAILISSAMLILSGCRGGNSSGAGMLVVDGNSNSGSGITDNFVSGSVEGPGPSFIDIQGLDEGNSSQPIVNPEPSSLLLFAGGLAGVVVYAKAKMGSKRAG